VIGLAAVTLLLGYLLLFAGIKGGEYATHPWNGLRL
jgi:hypothetical protein